MCIKFALLRSENPSGKCAKLHIVAASKNRDRPTKSLSSSPLASTINCSLASQAFLEVTHQDHSIGITLLLLVRAAYIWVLIFANIPFVMNRIFNATLTERLQQCIRAVLAALHTPNWGGTLSQGPKIPVP